MLLLNGMDIEQYAEKGVLKELDDFFLPYKEEGSLCQNIVEGMRMTGTNKIYAAPLNVFVPLYLTETKLAEDFLSLLLSDEMMRKWWLGSGYPIRKESLAKILDINDREWAQIEGLSADSINIWYADYVWPTKEEK